MSFDELGLALPILRAVAKEGYTVATAIQSKAIRPLIEGHDLLGCAQTGTGKTAAFALPILHRLSAGNAAGDGNAPRDNDGRRRQGRQASAPRPIRCLVLAPTRELAQQITESFEAYGRGTGVTCRAVYGGVSQHPQVGQLQRGIDVLVATPGRLVDLIDQGWVRLDRVEVFVLDEADRMLDMGFLPDMRRVVAELPRQRQTVMFSATMSPEIEQLANKLLVRPVRIRIAPERPAAERVEQSVYHVSKSEKPRLLVSLLSQPAMTRSLVFTRTKHGADRLVRQLAQSGIHAEAIHGNKSQAARQRSLNRFKTGHITVLVATDLAARGLDVDEVSHVLNYDLPHEPETYVHRIGRTARAGASGVAMSFCDGEQRKHLAAIEHLIRRSITVAHSDCVAEARLAHRDEPGPGTPAANRRHLHRRPSVLPARPKRGPKRGNAQPRVSGSRSRQITGAAPATGPSSGRRPARKRRW